jgi:N-acetylmuramoyl-L-alanine amidase
MREIDTIAIHCSYSKADQDIGVEEIREMHLDNGWRDIGYHFVIRRDGTVEVGRPVDEVGAHVKGYNRKSIGICLVGGKSTSNTPIHNFTPQQMNSLWALTFGMCHAYRIDDSRILGHRDFPGVLKECPCFDVQEWWKNRTNRGA